MAKKNKSRTKQARNLVGRVIGAMPLILPAVVAAATSLANNAELRDQRKSLKRRGLTDLSASPKSGKSSKKAAA